jgi:hypothetical protein
VGRHARNRPGQSEAEQHDLIGEPTLADAICDRLVHTAYVIELAGPSLRETRAKAQRLSPDAREAETPAPAPAPPAPRKRT